MRALALLMLFGGPLQARWWKVDSPPRSVLSEAGERQARDILARLELAHRVFSQIFPNTRHAPLPVTAYLLSSNRFRSVRTDHQTAGFYQSGPDRDSIVLEIGRPPRILFHEYAHLALHHSTGPLPSWMEEGLAEFYSTIEVAGTRVRIGAPIPSHIGLLAATSWMSSTELSQARTGNRHGTANPVFYSQSWAMVHMLRMHETYRARFGELLSALAAGEAQPQAFQRIYGRGFPDALIDLKTYVAHARLPVMEVAIPSADPAAVRSFAMAETDGETEFARLALQTGHGAEAAALYRKLTALRNPSTRDLESMGLLALEQRDQPAALRHLRQAIAMPDAGAVTYFEYALLLREHPPPDWTSRQLRDEVTRCLEEAVRRNPAFAEALFLLGTFAANAACYAEAVPLLQRAAAILPRQSSFWHALALSYHALHDGPNTHHAAQRALNAAQTAQEVEMARAAMRLSEPQSATPPVPEPAIRPATTTRAQGVLERVDCLGKPARLHVRVNGKPTAFWVDDPGAVLLKNQSSVTFEFRCGVIAPVPIVVEYTPLADADRLTVGYVVGLEFR
ncbi:MAG: hypothetical protein HY820_22830 [Acidobacteria bacterium]|nr:hypothetical protein [Acidobacteriota bacterium]